LPIRNSLSPLGGERRLPIGPGKGKKRNKEPLKPATGLEYPWIARVSCNIIMKIYGIYEETFQYKKGAEEAMGILSRDAILREIENGTIVIDPPVRKEDVGEGSIDLRLGDKFGQIRSTPNLVDLSETVIDSSADILPDVYWVKVKDYYLLPPNCSVVATTMEEVKLAHRFCGWITGRSRFVVLGLNVQISSGFVQPGSCGRLFFLINNISASYIKLVSGTKICQLILQDVES